MKKLAILCSVLAVTACGPSAKVEQSGDESTLTLGNGTEQATITTSTSASAPLPAGFTIYPGAQIVSNVTMKGSDGATMIVSMETGDDLERVTAFYNGQADRAGIPIAMNLKTPESAMLSGTRDGLDWSFTAGPKDGGGTTASLTFKTKG